MTCFARQHAQNVRRCMTMILHGLHAGNAVLGNVVLGGFYWVVCTG